jgi:hypothetical protein
MLVLNPTGPISTFPSGSNCTKVCTNSLTSWQLQEKLV